MLLVEAPNVGTSYAMDVGLYVISRDNSFKAAVHWCVSGSSAWLGLAVIFASDLWHYHYARDRTRLNCIRSVIRTKQSFQQEGWQRLDSGNTQAQSIP